MANSASIRERDGKDMPKISVCVPIHDMANGDWFLSRLINSLTIQTFRDFEVVITKKGLMAENTNEAIKRARGEIIKILYMDDYLAHKNALNDIVSGFRGGWMASGCIHDDGNRRFDPHYPFYNSDIHTGRNTIGSPSVICFENKEPLFFDEKLSWLLDCDLYKRLYNRYGEPTILNDLNVVIGVGTHQTTHVLSNEQKLRERDYLIKKYE